MDLFRNYCDVYFNKSDGAASQQNVETASSVLNALSNLLQGLQPTDGLPSIHEDAIRDCGLLSPDVDVSAYTKIQDDVRRAIHQRKMAERREAFSRLLDSNKTSTVVPSGSAETSTTSSSSSSIKGKVLTLSQLSQVKSSTQLFSQRYMSKQTTSGVQAFIGGLRELIKTQKKSDTVLQWKLDKAVFTETEGVYMRDAFSFVMSFLSIADSTSSIEAGAGEGDFVILKIDDSISDAHLNQILTTIPSKGDKGYDGLQTGSIVDSNSPRQNRAGEWDEKTNFFSQCCIIL